MAVFLADIFSSVVVATVCFLLVLAVKKAAGRYVTKETQYALWYVAMFVMILPFLPLRGFSVAPWFGESTGVVSAAGEGAGGSPAAFETGVLPDFSVPVNRGMNEVAQTFLLALWLMGFLLVAAFFFYGQARWFRIKRTASVADGKLLQLFDQCKREAGMKRNVQIRLSDQVEGPVVAGLFCPTVLFPAAGVCWKEKDVRFMLLHELGHVKHRDIPVNCLLWFLQAVYWFHPLVWRAFSDLRQEREQLCDHWVLKQLAEEQIPAYGLTILRYAGRKNAFSGAAGAYADFASSKQGLKRRIESIADFSQQTIWQKLRGIVVFLCVFLVAVSQSPRISLFAMTRPQTEDSMEEIDLERYFGAFDGSFVLSVPGREAYLVYNKDMAVQRRSPDSTYKIYSALFALAEGQITAEDNTLPWDGTVYPIEAWNQDQSLATAMKDSANWYFQALDAKTGFDRVQAYFRSIGYGNCDFRGGEDDYWMESSLKISPVEQVALLEKLNTVRLGFTPEDTTAVKAAMKISEKNGWTLYGKTGTGNVDGRTQNGWFVGWMEKADTAYYFALNLTGDDQATGSRASEIALEILSGQKLAEAL